eukprot:TRINITY_DN45351_c0_g1_i1.p1 TRINITY_DN45351_c0_g1~~TRINITY_DN45351_c0_g1_i1.p1  ORF type:complete len:590 (-),score=162.88 TRINITY_DN45351_c0_g1_i1:27-1796(-)
MAADPDMRHYNLSAFYEDNHVFAPPAPRPLPVVVITGFLGSGKTTLLRRLMRERDNLRIAAVAHDLAANVNVDAMLVASEKAARASDAAAADGAVVGLGGCACCDDFDQALRGIVGASVKRGTDTGSLDYLAIETSGAADPRRLIATIEQRFGPLTRARLDRVIAVVDAEQVVTDSGCERWLSTEGKQPLDAAEAKVQRAQLSCADVVLLNKVDLVDAVAGAREKATARLQALAPHARVLSCSFGEVPLTELLEVSVAPAQATPAVSHELAPMAWVVGQDLEPRPRPAAAAAVASDASGALEADGGLMGHAPRHHVVEWSSADEPVSLARLQELVSCTLPSWRSHLRRGKGVFWVAEDSGTRWEWQLSGRLRYACRRDVQGFGGAAPQSYMVLIFAASTPKEVLCAAEAALQTLRLGLASRPASSPAFADADEAAAAAAAVVAARPAFELLGDPEDLAGRGHRVLRFRLTGKDHFGIDPSVDLSEAPYGVDLDALNSELARLVSAQQGAAFLATGRGVDTQTGRPALALLWPLDARRRTASAQEAAGCAGKMLPQLPCLLTEMVSYAESEAVPLLQRYFAHVKSCQCGQ